MNPETKKLNFESNFWLRCDVGLIFHLIHQIYAIVHHLLKQMTEICLLSLLAVLWRNKLLYVHDSILNSLLTYSSVLAHPLSWLLQIWNKSEIKQDV